jgi:hypothetical protein
MAETCGSNGSKHNQKLFNKYKRKVRIVKETDKAMKKV